MMAENRFDPWGNVKSVHGISCDELISMLQKSIRRADEKNALAAAYEMHITSPQMSDKLWRRLLVISVEDIGFGNVHAPEVIWSLYKMKQDFSYRAGDQAMLFVYAVRYLCRSVKERSSDEMKCMLQARAQHGFTSDIPDYTFDMHTVQGREMGRGEVHFLEEASRVEPQLDEPWVKQLHDDFLAFCKLEHEEKGEPIVQAFLNTEWDYGE